MTSDHKGRQQSLEVRVFRLEDRTEEMEMLVGRMADGSTPYQMERKEAQERQWEAIDKKMDGLTTKMNGLTTKVDALCLWQHKAVGYSAAAAGIAVLAIAAAAARDLFMG